MQGTTTNGRIIIGVQSVLDIVPDAKTVNLISIRYPYEYQTPTFTGGNFWFHLFKLAGQVRRKEKKRNSRCAHYVESYPLTLKPLRCTGHRPSITWRLCTQCQMSYPQAKTRMLEATWMTL
jgi:hypothetical protein